MPRPPCCRRVSGPPAVALFVPAGADPRQLAQVAITLDELEALKLADLEGLYQEEAAARLGVSRPTFGRIIAAAHRKVAEALVEGKALRIEGGTVSAHRTRCDACKMEWEPTASTMSQCPRCRCPARAAKLAPARTPSTQTGDASPHVREEAPAKEKRK